MDKQTEEVIHFIESLQSPQKDQVEEVRKIILASNKDITEQIKWSAPSFCYAGDDRVTFKLSPEDPIQLIFHRGAKVKDNKHFIFNDESGLLHWLSPDRANVTFGDIDDIRSKKTLLEKLVTSWLEATRE